MDFNQKIAIPSLSSLFDFSGLFIEKLPLGMPVLLEGDLGAGKTAFVKCIGEQLSYSDVMSPSFNLVNRYPCQPEIIHLDLYRLVSSSDLMSIDIDDIFAHEDAYIFIEWPDRLGGFKPSAYWTVSFEFGEGDLRYLTISQVNA